MKIAAAFALLAATSLSAQDGPVTPPAKQLSIEGQTAMRCSAAFAIVAARQAGGIAQAYPDLTQRGREYFVRASARVMDEAGLDRAGVQALLTAQAQALADDPQALEQVMPPCLLALDASGL